MQKRILKFLLALVLLQFLVAAESYAGGKYDGIYSLNPNVGYVTVQEKQGKIIAVLNQTYDGEWMAFVGQLVGTSAKFKTIIGGVNMVIDVDFLSESLFVATQTSCEPTAEYYCLFEDGSSLVGTKVW